MSLNMNATVNSIVARQLQINREVDLLVPAQGGTASKQLNQLTRMAMQQDPESLMSLQMFMQIQQLAANVPGLGNRLQKLGTLGGINRTEYVLARYISNPQTRLEPPATTMQRMMATEQLFQTLAKTPAAQWNQSPSAPFGISALG